MTSRRVAVAAADTELRGRIVATLQASGLSVAGLVNAETAFAGPEPPELLVSLCNPENAAERGLLRRLARAREELRLIVVCETAGGRGARLALEQWVDGFVFSDTLESTLGPTAIAVLAGQAVVPRRMRALLRRPTLSFREKQILALVVGGYTNGQIGARLFLAESTVKSHLSSAFAKLGVRSRSDAAALVLDPEESRGLGMESMMEALGARDTSVLAVVAGAGG